MRYANLFGFWLVNINDKYSPWDRDQIRIKLGTDYIIYQKLAILFIKKKFMITDLKVSFLACKCVFYKTKQDAKCGLNFEGFEIQK